MKLLVQTSAQRSAGHLMLFQSVLEMHLFLRYVPQALASPSAPDRGWPAAATNLPIDSDVLNTPARRDEYGQRNR